MTLQIHNLHDKTLNVYIEHKFQQNVNLKVQLADAFCHTTTKHYRDALQLVISHSDQEIK